MKLLTNHARVLLHLHAHPNDTLREAAQALDLTERAIQRITVDLREAGYITWTRAGRQNSYTTTAPAALIYRLAQVEG